MALVTIVSVLVASETRDRMMEMTLDNAETLVAVFRP